MKLRNYQTEAHKNIRTWLAAGEQDMLLEMPVGSGKTFTVTHLANELLAAGTLRAVVVLVPQNLLKDTWGKDGAVVLKSARDLNWQRAKGLIIVTRQAVTARDADIEALRKGALRGVLVVADEGHHCADANSSGRTLATLRSKGAATLLVSATPWATAGNVGGEGCKAHRLSEVDYVSSFGPDDAHHPPGRFITGRVLVGKPVRDAEDTIDRSGSVRKSAAPEGDEAKARRFCTAMAKRWADDGFPRAVFNVPLQAWAAPLAKALRKVKPDADLLDLVGEMSTAELDAARARLAHDSAATRWRDVQISAVMSCARMDEGTDWVPCSHVYNVGIPAVPGLILQRWGRAARAKGKISGYPKRWADARTLVFFTPPGTGEGDTWKAQTEVAWLLGGFLADYRAALEWTQERKARGVKGPLPVPASSPVVAAWQGKLAEQVQRVGGEMSPDDARAWLARQKKAPPPEVIDTVVRRMQMQDPKHRAEEDERQGSGLRVRAARRPEAAPLIEDVFKTPLRSAPAFETMVEFTAREGKEIAERMAKFRTAQWSDMSTNQLNALARAAVTAFQARIGRQPVISDGPCVELGGESWGSLHSALRTAGGSLAEIKGTARCRDYAGKVISGLLAFRAEHGAMPSTADPLYSKWKEVARRHPIRLSEAGLPLVVGATERGMRIRKGRGVSQYDSLGKAVADVARAIDATLIAASTHGGTRFRGDIPTILRLTKSAIGCATLGRSGDRGLGVAKDRCQVSTLGRLYDEVRTNCWALWLDGATDPDPRPWAAILASGDHKRVVKAERVAFLDWENPGPDGKPVRRKWSPPCER